jgi:site-specific recombinase XerC
MTPFVPFAAGAGALFAPGRWRTNGRKPFGFFVSNIRNAHTRRAYGRAIGEFFAWCERQGAASIADVQPLHVGAYVEALTRSHSAPTAKQRLAASRRLFDWLVTGQIVPVNPPRACGRSTSSKSARRPCRSSRGALRLST